MSADRDLVLVDAGLPCDTFNLACRARLADDTAPDRVREALAFFDQSGHPFSWWLGPGHTPAGLGALLAEVGLQEAESSSAMSIDLRRLPEAPVRPRALQVRRVRSRDELRAFAKIAAANWSPPDTQVMDFYRLAEAALLAPESPHWLYLGLLDVLPIATAELTLGGGVAGLYNISTVNAYRGRGIGSVLVYAPLAEARAAGYETAILQAAPDGVGVYQRLGFTPFGTVTEYKRGDLAE